MKRFFSILMVGMAIMLFPVVASAKLNIEEVGECKMNSDDTCERTYKISITSDTEQSYQQIPIKITFAPKDGKQNGITKLEFETPEGWSAIPNSSETGYDIIYAYANGTYTGKNVDLGTIVATIKADAEIYDCSAQFQFGEEPEVTVEITYEESPNTGASLPVIVIGAGVVIAAVVYVISKKNTKLYKI